MKSRENSKLAITRFSTLFGRKNQNSNTSVSLSRDDKLYTEARLISGEIIVAVGFNSSHNSEKSSEEPLSSPAVLVLNLSTPECREKYQEFLSETLLPSKNREEFLSVISGFVGQSIKFQANANDAESTPIVYPVSTFMEIHADKDYTNNNHLNNNSDFVGKKITHPILIVRELATLTKTRDHGSADSVDSRVERAKEDILNLSDNFSAMITKRGAVFFTGDKVEPINRFSAANHYVTTLYSGVLSLILLAQSCNAVVQTNLNSLAYKISSIDIETSENNSQKTLQDALLSIQKELFRLRMMTMWLDMNLNYFYRNEKKNIKSIAQKAAEQFSLTWNSKHIQEELESILSVVDIQRKVVKTELESARIDEREQSQESQDQTNFLLTIFTFITLPLTVSYPLFEFGWIEDDRRDINIFWIITFISISIGFFLAFISPKIFKFLNSKNKK